MSRALKPREGGPWWVDRQTRIVIRYGKAVQLTLIEFAVFMALNKSPNRQLSSQELANEVYRGVTDPPLYANGTIGLAARAANVKLARLKLRMAARNRQQHSYWRLAAL